MGRLGGLTPREMADGKVGAGVPRQIERTAAHLVRVGQVEKRRQLVARLNRGRIDQLRHGQQLDSRFICVEPSVGQDTVGRPQVDSDDEFGIHSSFRLVYIFCRSGDVDASDDQLVLNSTSAGATIRAAISLPDHCGTSQRVAFHPWWTMTPRKGGSPVTSPVRR